MQLQLIGHISEPTYSQGIDWPIEISCHSLRVETDNLLSITSRPSTKSDVRTSKEPGRKLFNARFGADFKAPCIIIVAIGASGMLTQGLPTCEHA